MTPETSPEIRRLCRLIRTGGAVFVAALVVLYVALWVTPQLAIWGQPIVVLMRSSVMPIGAIDALSIGQRLAVGAVGLPSLLALAYAFYRLDAMLRGFERADFFERATVGHLRAFSGFVLLAKVLSLVLLHLRVWLMSHFLGNEQQLHVVVALTNDDLAVLLMCALFFLIARMMEEGRRLAEENRGFV